MAATIQSSVVLEDQEQHNGRRRIVEVHTDSDGVAHRLSFLAEADHDAPRELAAHARKLEARLEDEAIDRTHAARRASMLAKIDAYVKRADPLVDIGLSVDEKEIMDTEGDRR